MHAAINPQDSTIDFEKRRNVPVRYDRELVQTTIKAMKRIAEIKQKRERAFWKNRYAHALLLTRLNSGGLNPLSRSEWWPAETRYAHTAKRSWSRSNCSSQHRPRVQKSWSRRKSRSPPNQGVLCFLERDGQWAWISIRCAFTFSLVCIAFDVFSDLKKLDRYVVIAGSCTLCIHD